MITIKATGFNELQQKFGTANKSFRDYGYELQVSTRVAVRSIRTNFDVGGRPEPWEPSQRVIHQGGKTLIDTEALYNSVEESRIFRGLRRVNNAQILELGPDESLGYGLNLHLGEPGLYPARPWFLLQQEDEIEIVRIFKDGVERRLKAAGLK